MRRRLLLLLSLLLTMYGTTALAQPVLGFHTSPAITQTPPIAPGQSVTLTFRVQNTGTSSSSAFNAYIRLRDAVGPCSTNSGTDKLLGMVSVPSIGAGLSAPLSSKNFTIPSNTPVGSKKICVWLGSTATVPVDVTPDFLVDTAPSSLPVVTPSVVNVSPASVVAGSQVVLSFSVAATVANAPAGQATVQLDDNANGCEATDRFLTYVNYPALTKDAAATPVGPANVTIPSNANVGAGRRLCVSTGGTPVASNTFDVSGNVAAVITPSEAVVAQSSVVAGNQVTLTFKVAATEANAPSGQATIRYDTGDGCSSGDTYITSIGYPALTKDAAATTVGPTNVTIPVGASPGTPRRLCVFTGTPGTSSNSFEVVPQFADITPSNVRTFGPHTTELPSSSNPTPHITPGTMTNADTLTVAFDVTNIGNQASYAAHAEIRLHVDANPELPTPCSDSDQLLALVAVSGLAPSASTSVTKSGIPIPHTTPINAAHRVCVKVDSSDNAGQPADKKGNDRAEAKLVVGALPDLVPTDIQVTPNPTTGNGTATLSFKIYNQGKGTSNPSHVRAFVSDYPSLAGGHVLGTNGDEELIVYNGPCAVPEDFGWKPASNAPVPGNCVGELAPGATSDTMLAYIQVPGGLFGSYNLGPGNDGNGAVRNQNGSFTLTANPTTWSYVNFVPGRYVWVVADSGVSPDFEKEGGQTLAILESNDAQNVFLASEPMTYEDLEYFSANFAHVSGGIGGGTPRMRVRMGTKSFLVHFGPPSSFVCAAPCIDYGSMFNLRTAEDNGRYDNTGLPGAHYSTLASALENLGPTDYITRVTMIMDTWAGAPENGENDDKVITLHGIHLY